MKLSKEWAIPRPKFHSGILVEVLLRPGYYGLIKLKPILNMTAQVCVYVKSDLDSDLYHTKVVPLLGEEPHRGITRWAQICSFFSLSFW